jgi:Lipocalin-like domain
MKNTIFGSNLLAFGLLALLLPGLVGCKKDKDVVKVPTMREQVVGEWEIESFTIDGTEVKGSVVNSSQIEFETYTGSNGDFEWYFNYNDGTSETQSGDYEVDEVDAEISLESNDGDKLKLDLKIENDKLELSGIVDGERLVIKAERD